MSVRLIRNARDLPDWYKITNYERVKKLDAAGWYKALTQRASHLNFLETLGPAKHQSLKSLHSNLLKLRENPFYVPKNEEDLSILGGVELLTLENHRAKFSKFLFAIAPLTLRKLYQKEYFLRPEVRKKARKYIDALYQGRTVSSALEKWCRLRIDEPLFDVLKADGDYKPGYELRLGTRTKDIVEVDFSLPDKILKEQFSQYLRQTRKNYLDLKEPFGFKRPIFSKWHRYGILPYLDLKIWAFENHLKIPHRVIADAIFPLGEEDEEAVRKTTQKLVEEILSPGYLKFLASIVAEDGRR